MRKKPIAPLTPEQQQLAADNERLIHLAIRRYAPNEDADDLYGHAAEGLLRAASTYDPTRGKFSTHAMWCMRGEIAHRKLYAQQRKRSGMLILYTDDNDTAFDSAGKYDHTQRGAVKPKDRPRKDFDDSAADISRFLDTLTPVQRQTVCLRMAGYTYADIAAIRSVKLQAAYQAAQFAAKRWQEYNNTGTAGTSENRRK